MPATLLEGLQGRARRQRLRVLGSGSAAGWLTIICAHFEVVLWLSGLVLIAMLVPDPLPGPGLDTLLFAEAGAWLWVATLLNLVVMSLLAPFYVAAGFALYLSRRTALEAWDLELAFRRHGATGSSPGRRPPRSGGAPVAPQDRSGGSTPASGRVGAGMASILPLLLLPATIGFGEPVQAGTATVAPPVVPTERIPDDGEPIRLEALTPQRAKAGIEAVLAGEDFGRRREETRWVYVGESADRESPDWEWNPGPLGDLIVAVAAVLKWLLLIAAAVLLLLLAQRLLLELRRPRRERRRRPAGPGIEIGRALPATPVLPTDIPAAVRDLLAAGRSRAALALLYRAQIAHLRRIGLGVPDSATEHDCLAIARSAAGPEEQAWLARLTGLWQRAAYAHRPVAAEAVKALLAARPRGPADARSSG
jgi:hypothetical protein